MKVIFFDIDGTLIDENHHMLESTKEAIQAARKNGHLCFINTGRTNCLVENSIAKMTEFDGFVMGCGTMISMNHKILHHHSFSRELGNRIIEGLLAHQIDAVLERDDRIFHRRAEEMFTTTFFNYMKPFMNQCPSGSYEDCDGVFDKFFCYSDTPSQIMDFLHEFENELDFIDREHGYFEVLPKGYSKAFGIKKLMAELDLSMEDTIAVGDSNNDKEMMLMAHTSIAMGNSNAEIKEIATFVTTDVDKDGIQNALKAFHIC